MPNEELEKTNKPASQPSDARSIVEKNIVWIAIALFVVYFLTKFYSGKEAITIIEIIGILAILIGIDIVIKMYTKYINYVPQTTIHYVPFDPKKDYPFIENELLQINRRVDCRWHTCDPPFGEKSSEPYMVYIRANLISSYGIVNRIMIAVTMPTRSIVKLLNGWKLESDERDWSGAQKDSQERTLRYYMPSPAYIKPVMVPQQSTQENDDDKDEEKEEKE